MNPTQSNNKEEHESHWELAKEKLLSRRKINPVSGCWEWTGGTGAGGYGYLWIKEYRRAFGVHRVAAFLWLNFDILQPYDVDSPTAVCHKCDNSICFNPEHLFVGTARENIKDAREKGRSIGIRNRRLSGHVVREIRRQALEPFFNQSKTARQYGVSQAAIYNIVRGNTYRDVE